MAKGRVACVTKSPMQKHTISWPRQVLPWLGLAHPYKVIFFRKGPISIFLRKYSQSGERPNAAKRKTTQLPVPRHHTMEPLKPEDGEHLLSCEPAEGGSRQLELAHPQSPVLVMLTRRDVPSRVMLATSSSPLSPRRCC